MSRSEGGEELVNCTLGPLDKPQGLQRHLAADLDGTLLFCLLLILKTLERSSMFSTKGALATDHESGLRCLAAGGFRVCRKLYPCLYGTGAV